MEMDMADSLFGSLIRVLDSRDPQAIGSVPVESEYSVSRCIQNSAAVMGTRCAKALDRGAFRKALEQRPSGWVAPLVLAALALGLGCGVEHNRSTSTGAASRAKNEVTLTYETGSMKLTPQSQVRLNQLAAEAKANTDMHLKVAGFTDNVGSEDNNLRLSQQRADNVRNVLIHKGVARGRVTAKGYGEADPIATNETSEGRSANRRVTISLE
jgi:outer membrane protein OmpA-like peptidoglycan-associated protein